MYDYFLTSICLIDCNLRVWHFWNVISVKKNQESDFLKIQYLTSAYGMSNREEKAFHVNQIRNMQIVVQDGYLKDDPFKEVIEWPPK